MYRDWNPYVPVGQRLAQAAQFAKKKAKKEGRELSPVKVHGRKLSTKFWGQAWCDNLNYYSDISNRLSRGRTYLGNGSVVDLHIQPGIVNSIVAGSETYEVRINIKALAPKTWKALQRDCAQSIHSLLDLLQGRFDEGVMQRLARRDGGLFPQRREITMECSCPDDAGVCKHIAAVMYGVGVRLDTSPELLFMLRNVDHSELISRAVTAENLEHSLVGTSSALDGSDLGELFGIDLEVGVSDSPEPPAKARRTRAKKIPTPKVRSAKRVVTG